MQGKRVFLKRLMEELGNLERTASHQTKFRENSLAFSPNFLSWTQKDVEAAEILRENERYVNLISRIKQDLESRKEKQANLTQNLRKLTQL